MGGDPEYRVCDRWQSWFNFIADVGAQPTPEHVIGRIDKTHGFETGNCCWATRKEMLAGKRNWTFEAWSLIVDRCTDNMSADYLYYGGRGIECMWQTYAGFVADMGHAPAGTALHRLDVDKGYCKDNCKWAVGREVFVGAIGDAARLKMGARPVLPCNCDRKAETEALKHRIRCPVYQRACKQKSRGKGK